MSLLTTRSISFPEGDYSFHSDDSQTRRWLTPEGDPLTVNPFNIPPDLTADPSSVVDVRAMQRRMAAVHGLGLIEADVRLIDGYPAIWSIFKAPMQPHGMLYLGSYIVPFRDGSLVVKLQCPERGMTGIRDSLVLDQKLGEGTVKPTADGRLIGWFRDPYNVPSSAPLLWNLSEAESYDSQFPEHPLSRLRSRMRALEPLLTVGPEAKNLAPFVYPPVAVQKKPWWKRGS